MDTFTGIIAAPGLLKNVAALKQKSAGSSKRIEGELPSAPPVAGDVPKWWDETTTVLERIRTETNESLGKVEARISASNIKKLYEDNGDTNSFSDYHKDRLEHLEDALGIEGNALGTGGSKLGPEEGLNQSIDNTVIGGGSF